MTGSLTHLCQMPYLYLNSQSTRPLHSWLNLISEPLDKTLTWAKLDTRLLTCLCLHIHCAGILYLFNFFSTPGLPIYMYTVCTGIRYFVLCSYIVIPSYEQYAQIFTFPKGWETMQYFLLSTPLLSASNFRRIRIVKHSLQAT